ncbi:DNA repair protein Rad50 [Hamiltosporidium magnivora]|uniref:DNA repair protein Rad50 n=1 Tax=Hamiltosporidium magnivora TaxID=148818 RepID=A0A4V2JVU4_9MICR|nr:DNA repair protein Rad50 [Hamiltosporidium magnivora]
MSSIQKLMIRGIRSFHPNTANYIQFYSPLTLIAGPNGSGKTTIIECLKYVCTGELPPNGRNGAFIYDPKLAHEVDVKAQIKLKFLNLHKQTIVATRSLLLTQKKSKVEQKNIENVLLLKTDNGECISISSKCVDMDREISFHLGVPSYILESVIFCHQEENTWPLSEPINLKKKLDNIFCSTKYTKAIESLKSCKKNSLVELKLKKQQLEFNYSMKIKKENLESKIESTETYRNTLMGKVEIIEGKEKELIVNISMKEQELEKYKKMEKNILEIENEVKSLQMYENNLNLEFKSIESDISVVNECITESELKVFLDENNLNLEFKSIESDISLENECITESELEVFLDENEIKKIENKIFECKNEEQQHNIEYEKIVEMKSKIEMKIEKLKNLESEKSKYLNNKDNFYKIFYEKINSVIIEIKNDDFICKILNKQEILKEFYNLYNKILSENDIENRINRVDRVDNSNNNYKVDNNNYKVDNNNYKVDSNTREKHCINTNTDILIFINICNKLYEKILLYSNNSLIKNKEEFLKKEEKFKEEIKKMDNFFNEKNNELIYNKNKLNTMQDKLNEIFEELFNEYKNVKSKYNRDSGVSNRLENKNIEQRFEEKNIGQEFEEKNIGQRFEEKNIEQKFEEKEAKLKYFKEIFSQFLIVSETFDENDCSLFEEQKIIAKELEEKQIILNEALKNLEKSFYYKNLNKKKLEIERNVDINCEYSKELVELNEKIKNNKNKLNFLLKEQERWKIREKQRSEKIKNINEQLLSIKYEINQLNIKLENKKDCFDVESIEEIQDLSKNLEECNNALAATENAHLIYKNFQKLGYKKSECPLCKKSMSVPEKNEFYKRLEIVITKIPETKNENELKREELMNKKNKLEIKNEIKKEKNQKLEIYKKLSKIYEKMINNLEEDDSIEEVDSSFLKEEESNNYNDMEFKHSEIPLYLNVLEKEMSEDDIKQRILEKNIKLKNEFEEIIYELKNEEPEVSIEKIQREYNQIKEKFDVNSRKIEIRNKNLEKFNLKSKIENLENQKNILSNSISILQKIIENTNIDALECERKNKIKIFEDEKQFYNEKLQKTNECIYKYKTLIDGNKNIKKEIEFILENLSKIEEEMEKNGFDSKNPYILKILKDDVGFRENLMKIKSNLVNLNNLLNRKKNNFKKAKIILEKRENKKKINLLNKKLKEFDFKELNSCKETLIKLQNLKNNFISEKNHILGELKQINSNLKMFKTELLTEYPETLKKYLKSYVECKTLDLILNDIEKSIKALDKSIVDFHSVKIAEVNQTLKNLWQDTYKGNDIDFIELRSESIGTKTYNYKIVMIKNGIELDMRGRCSAGQKVIASILIRLALADSFASHCGIMALDEPTTNLDKENIEALAFTLNQIIKERRNNNFQFVIITHDEEFVKMICKDDGCEYFYRLIRNSKGDSIIERHSVY